MQRIHTRFPGGCIVNGEEPGKHQTELSLAYGDQTSEVQFLSLGFIIPSHFILWWPTEEMPPKVL